jgi:hypothetical protein
VLIVNEVKAKVTSSRLCKNAAVEGGLGAIPTLFVEIVWQVDGDQI